MACVSYMLKKILNTEVLYIMKDNKDKIDKWIIVSNKNEMNWC